MMTMSLSGDVTRIPVTLNITTDQASLYNAYTEAGSPTAPCDVFVNISAGVALKAGFDTGTWPATSTFRINKAESSPGAGDGAIVAGTGGFGAPGGSATTSSANSGGIPGNGGDAIVIHLDVSIWNTGGFVFGGGGGGGGGGGAAATGDVSAGGGGGGGGRGYNNAVGGDGGTGTAGDSLDGAAGSSSAAGAGSTGNSAHGTNTVNGGNGGNGGTWGAAGSPGTDGSTVGLLIGSDPIRGSGSAGGIAGYAVRKNGHTVTWIGGNDATHVKGVVA